MFVKLNTDGSCRQLSCGAGGIIRDHNGDLICAFTKPLGEGSSSWAEASTLLFGIKWCVDNGLTNIMAESDSKMIVDCVNVNNNIPRKIINEVKEIKECLSISNSSVVHGSRESNMVADRLASMSHSIKQFKLFHEIKDLPTRIRGLINVDKWELAAFRTSRKRNNELSFDPP